MKVISWGSNEPLSLFSQSNRTCTEITSRAASVGLQQHTLGRHLCPKSSLDVVHKILAVRTVHPDSFPQRVLDIHLETNIRFGKSFHMAAYCTIFFSMFTDSYFNKDLRPVLILLVGRHQQIASENRHKAVSLCFKVDRGIATQETAQRLESNTNADAFHLLGSLWGRYLCKAWRWLYSRPEVFYKQLIS